MNKLFIFLIGSIFILQGCSSQTAKPAPYEEEPTAYTPGEFNQESLYALLMAELAGQRRLYPVAFRQYFEQAKKTQDSAVAERATRIAQYIRDPDKILQAAQLWRSISPQSAEPYQLEANILQHKGLHKEALPLLMKALESDPLRTLALIRTQISGLEADIVDNYLGILTDYRQQAAPRADLELTLALLHEKKEDFNNALTAFDRSLVLEPENPEALIHKAEMLKSSGDAASALSMIESAVEKQPENRQLQILYTQLLFIEKQNEEGVKQAQALLTNNANDHQLTFYLALLMLDHQQFDGAKNALNALFLIRPEDSAPYFYLGHIAQKQEQIPTAIQHYLKVSHGNNILPALSRATGLLNQPTDKTQVQKILKEGRAQHPILNAQLYTLEAEWLNLHNFPHESEAILEEALSISPLDTTLLYTRAMMIEGNSFPQAEKDLRQILKLEPDNALVKNALGYTLTLHTTRYEEALTLIREALKTEPEDPAILDSMGWVLHKLGRHEDALPYLEKAHQLYSDPEVSSHLIQVYWLLGQKENALSLLKSSSAATPDNPFLKEAEAVINAPNNGSNPE